ncbi:hypothetical protein JCM1393_05790 [Clostridium carnis]
MPGIWNVNNSYNINSKKVTSKLAFDVGEKFSGKVVKKGDGNEATIKLLDGWEFDAEIEGDIDSLEKGLQRFQVDGFENGKLKLKVISKNVSESQIQEGEFNEIISNEGLSKGDGELLKEMLKYDIPLTRENIKEVKSLIQFLNKIQANPKEIDEFVQKYLDSKGIDVSSEKGENISNNLKSFFQEFKSLSKEDILLFLENNIEFTKENVEGYKNIFKDGGKLEDILNKISKGMKFEGNIKEDKLDINIKTIETNINGKETEVITKENSNNINGNIAKDIYEKQDTKGAKVSMLALLKSIVGKGEDQVNITLKEILNSRRTEFTSLEFEKAFNDINSIKPEDFINLIKDISKDVSSLGYKDVVDDFNEYVNKSRNESKGIFEAIDFPKSEVEKILTTITGKNISLTEDEYLKLKDIVNLKIQEGEASKQPDETLKQEGKVLDKEANIENKSLNKEVSTNNNSNNKEVLNKVEKELIKNQFNEIQTKDINKPIIKEGLSTQELVKEMFISKQNEGKEVVKEILSKLNSENPAFDKIVDVIKNNINEIKLFNKISQEYYYTDIPLNIKEKEYPCKLIVKDNRKDGKKIDSTNVKMVVTVKTSNLGTIDGYIKVLDKRMDIDLKCEESSVKIVNMAKEKLSNNIQSLGFITNIKVIKKEEEVSLTSCREFFGDNNSSIDIKV